MVGMVGFEPTSSRSRSECLKPLGYIPMVPTPRIELDSFALQANVITRPTQLAKLSREWLHGTDGFTQAFATTFRQRIYSNALCDNWWIVRELHPTPAFLQGNPAARCPTHKIWRERWELNPLERVPQTRAAPFGFSPHIGALAEIRTLFSRIQAEGISDYASSAQLAKENRLSPSES